MDRLGGGLRQENAAVTTGKHGAAPFKGKFKLHTLKKPLPPLPLLLAKNQSSLETKPKAQFLKHKNTMSSTYGTSRFTQPLTVDSASKKSSRFNFLKLQSKPRNFETSTSTSFVKGATSRALPSTKVLLNKLSVKSLANKTIRHANEADKAPLFKLQAKGGLPFTFRADTKSSAAKKRKATETATLEGGVGLLFCKSRRVRSSNAGLMLKSTAFNKDKEKDKDKLTEMVRAENVGRREDIRSSLPFAVKMGRTGVKVDDGVVLKKQRLLLGSSEVDPAQKKSKRTSQTALEPLQDTEVAEAGQSSSVYQGEDSSVFMPNSEETPSVCAAGPMNSTPLSAEALLSSGEGEIEEDLAMKFLCIVDDDKEDEFLTRAAAIQELTDRVGLEQKQIHNRLLDVHADISESLLDALTDLMAEGGTGIDKLAYDMNIDAANMFLQDDEIQVFM